MNKERIAQIESIKRGIAYMHEDEHGYIVNHGPYSAQIRLLDELIEKAECFDKMDKLFSNGVTVAKNAKNIGFLTDLAMWRDTIRADRFGTLANALMAVAK